jgi:predicted ribosome quality control (RQC) complex YloA/Tae2 family protein
MSEEKILVDRESLEDLLFYLHNQEFCKEFDVDGFVFNTACKKLASAFKDEEKLEVERDALQARIKQLEEELEEERQENASLRSGDDYLRGAE